MQQVLHMHASSLHQVSPLCTCGSLASEAGGPPYAAAAAASAPTAAAAAAATAAAAAAGHGTRGLFFLFQTAAAAAAAAPAAGHGTRGHASIQEKALHNRWPKFMMPASMKITTIIRKKSYMFATGPRLLFEIYSWLPAF